VGKITFHSKCGSGRMVAAEFLTKSNLSGEATWHC
jgi:hypothetical protein